MSYPAYMARPKTYAILNTKTIDPLLIRLLSLCTTHGTEEHIRDIIKNLPYVKKNGVYTEVEDNAIVVVNPTNKVLENMFSSHMDIVGDNDKKILDQGKVEKIQIMMDKHNDFVWGAKVFVDENGRVTKYEISTLGADDKVGVYLMLKMIAKNIPGIYVFHVGEECGGIGSKALTTKHKDIFANIKRAIAFDRAGYQDVISFQRGGRTASKLFTEALAKALNETGFIPPKALYKGDVTGVFTDTANYKDFIPECTNISVGYFNQHGSSERLDHIWLRSCLEPAIMLVDWDQLPIERDPKAVTTYTYPRYNYGDSEDYGGYGYGNNSYYANKKKWHEIDDKTPIPDLPNWYPAMGWPQGCTNVAGLKATILKYLVQSTTTHYAKEQVAELLAKSLAEVLVLKETDNVQKKMISDLLNKDKPKGEIKLLPKPDVKETIETPAQELTKEMDNIEREENLTEGEEDCIQKKNLLAGIVLVVGRIPTPYKGVDPLVFRGYGMSSAKFLEAHKDTKRFTVKENRKVNRILLDVTIMLSKLQMDEDDDIVETLTDDLWQYVAFHKNENEFSDLTGAWNKWGRNRSSVA